MLLPLLLLSTLSQRSPPPLLPCRQRHYRLLWLLKWHAAAAYFSTRCDAAAAATVKSRG